MIQKWPQGRIQPRPHPQPHAQPRRGFTCALGLFPLEMGGQRMPKPEPGSLGSLCLYLGLDTFGLSSVFTRVRYLCSLCQRMGLGRLPLAWMAWTRAISWATSLEGDTDADVAVQHQCSSKTALRHLQRGSPKSHVYKCRFSTAGTPLHLSCTSLKYFKILSGSKLQ